MTVPNAAALARHFREAEGLSIAQIAERLDRSPATIKAYFYDPAGEKARAVKARYVGVCRGCGAYTQPRNGKGDAYRYCKRCHPGAIKRKTTQELLMVDWLDRYGRLPSSNDWSRTHARRRGGSALKRLDTGEWPSASVVGHVFGSWQEARDAASTEVRTRRPCALAQWARDSRFFNRGAREHARPMSELTNPWEPWQRLIDSIGSYYRGRLFEARDQAKAKLGELDERSSTRSPPRAAGSHACWTRRARG